ncbi:DUF11 domain-containing protein [Frankia sp. CcI49]|uniref:DUF11 domain-containing protein n=1 Tax=Frankia sp. CcI49 TaxID=1745382 RepID=UPI000A02F29D|nr:DUF11 domain-containing protein [Frankia sp. CcI49]
MGIRAALGRLGRPGRARLGVALTAAALVGPLLTTGTAQAATVNPGSLKQINKKAVAGAQGVALGWTYRAQKPTAPGTITIAVPAGFSAPQSTAPSAPGYLSAISGCAQFQVVGTTAQPDGSNVIAVATNCADGQTATLSYGNVTVPTTPGTFAFPATFIPTGATAIPFADPGTVTVSAGAPASLTISPATSTIIPGATQAYTVRGFDAFGNEVSLDPDGSRFSISPNGSCTGAACTATTAGTHTVTVKNKGLATTAILTVGAAPAEADLAVTESVNVTSPVYYDDVIFTTTVTNGSATTTAHGVTAAVAIPAWLVAPSASPSGTTTFASSTGVWTIGDLAPGAQATLTVSGSAGDVALGAQTLTATVSATTPDPKTANNTASATATSQQLPATVVVAPDPNNPPFLDISAPGTASWTFGVVNNFNPAAPAPTEGSLSWTCSTASFNPCPSATAVETANTLVLTFTVNDFAVDEYNIQVMYDPGPTANYAAAVGSLYFGTTNSGG